jgi:hypothetical protein
MSGPWANVPAVRSLRTYPTMIFGSSGTISPAATAARAIG